MVIAMDNSRDKLPPGAHARFLAARARDEQQRAAERAAERAAFVRSDVLTVSQRSEKSLSHSDKCDVAGGRGLRPIGAVNKCSTNALRDDVRAEGLEAYSVNSVNPVTPNPHSIVNGTIGDREVSRPTITRPPPSAAPPSPGTLLPLRSCVRCTYDFYPKAVASRPGGYSYCGSCHRELNFAYCRALRARKVALRREYLISRGDLAPDAGVGGAAGSSPDLAALLACRG